MTDRTGLVPVVMVVMVVRRRDMDRLCCTAAKAVKRWLRVERMGWPQPECRGSIRVSGCIGDAAKPKCR